MKHSVLPFDDCRACSTNSQLGCTTFSWSDRMCTLHADHGRVLRFNLSMCIHDPWGCIIGWFDCDGACVWMSGAIIAAFNAHRAACDHVIRHNIQNSTQSRQSTSSQIDVTAFATCTRWPLVACVHEMIILSTMHVSRIWMHAKSHCLCLQTTNAPKIGDNSDHKDYLMLSCGVLSHHGMTVQMCMHHCLISWQLVWHLCRNAQQSPKWERISPLDNERELLLGKRSCCIPNAGHECLSDGKASITSKVWIISVVWE